VNETLRLHDIGADEPPRAPRTAPEPAPKKDVEGPKELRCPLRKPIMAYGEEIAELVFREPTAMDIIRNGNPVNFEPWFDPPKLTFDAPKMSAMMSELAKVPLASIGKMSTQDWESAAWILAGFFVPVPGSV
jgi:hypothetical protein